ncbi:MAG: ATP-binding protein [Rhodospirillaceae bacterium]
MTVLEAGLKIDFNECGREAVHTPGVIQSCGVLAALDAAASTISHVSDNTSEVLGRFPEEYLGRPAFELVGAVGAAFLDDRVRRAAEGCPCRLPVSLTVRGEARLFSLVGHRWDGRIVIELEPEPAAAPVGQTAVSAGFAAAIAAAADLFQIARAAVREVRRLTGSDRTQLYRLLGDAGGEVIAEERLPIMTPFLGLRFPPHDYPPTARRLQLLLPVRVIPDVHRPQSAILAADAAADGRGLDLSCAQLRGVSRYCVEFYKNIAISGSLTAAIEAEGALFGIISCHDRTARSQPWLVREAVAEAARLTGQAVERLLAAGRQRDRLRSDRRRSLIAGRAARADNVLTDFVTYQPRLSSLVGAGGIALISGPAVFRRGWTPPAGDLIRLADWLIGQTKDGDPVFESDCLSAVYPPARDWQVQASGLIAAVISREPRALLLCFRPELRHEVLWGGDPGRPVVVDEARRLHPRASFERWREEVRGRSRPWSPEDRTLIEAVVGHLVAQAAGGAERAALVAAAISRCSDWFANDEVLREEMLNVVSELMAFAVHSERDGRAVVVSANHRLCDLFGIDMSEAVGGEAGLVLDRIGLAPEILDPRVDFPPCEVDVWSDAIGLRTVRVAREVVAETTGRPEMTTLVLIRLQDITEFKRTADALNAAREQAQASEQNRTQFLASMSHELRTPLNAIIGFAEAIKSEIVGPVGVAAYRGYASTIYSSGYHLLGLITDLLDFSTIEAGRRMLREEPCDLAELSRDVFRWVQMQFADKALAWSLDIPAGPVTIRCDSSAIRQAVINLLTNAGKYSRPGGRVLLRLVDVRDRDTVITVEDNGVGIKPADQQRLFNPFERGSDPRSLAAGGTGLGLVITRSLIELHGGTVELLSDGYNGTTARLVLPGWRRLAVAAAPG